MRTEAIPVLFIDGPLDGQYEMIQENKDKEHHIWQLQGEVTTKITYKASEIDYRFYFLHTDYEPEEKPTILYEQMKTVLGFVRSGAHGIGIEQAISVLKRLAVCDNFKPEWRREIVDLYQDATLQNSLTALPGA